MVLGLLAEMVDVASRRTMPSENELHVARNFLSKILRSSMRKNEPGVRPHSWHSSKLTEEESEPAGSQAATAPPWQPKHEASSKESTKTEKAQHSNQLSSVNSMERLERHSHPYPPGCLSPPQYMNGSEPFGGSGAKRDSAFSCFSGSSSPPVLHPSMSVRKGASTENIFFKGLQSEGPQQNEPHRFLQPALGNWQGPRGEEQPASRVSAPGRAGVGPVWQVPEKKKSQSPPPPPLPLRSDSFAATKVFPFSEDSHSNSFEKLTENQNRLRFQNQLHPNKLFSLSSSDVSLQRYVQSTAHHMQCSDESPFYLQTRTAPPTKTQSVGSYYRSLQDLPSNAFSRKHTRHSTAAMTGQDSGGHSRHLGPSGNHQMQTGKLKARKSKAGGRRGDTEKSQQMNSSESGFHSSLKANVKAKHPTPQSHIPHCENQDPNGNGVYYETSLQSTEESSKRASDEMKRLLHQSIDHKVGLSRHQDPWMLQEDHRISNQKTPLLHFLAQESQTLAERQAAAATTSLISTQDICETTTNSSVKASRRSDRYATTLRKEIQQKRAQLQKSRSAATLMYEVEEDDAEEWRSIEASASSNTYKDHLKEAQARVLQATSFQRRDLEPLGPEAPVLKAAYGRIRGRRRFHPANRTHSFSEPDMIDKVGVDGEPQSGSEQQRKFLETKPSFPRPVLKSGHGSNLNPSQDDTSKSGETFLSGESDQSQPHTDEQSPGEKQVLLEQQRLGTFAEYQATWNKQKKSPDAKTQGRCHSAENILDSTAEEKGVCIHERSRSSPSADFYTQISSHWTDSQMQESSLSTRETAGSPDRGPVPRTAGFFTGAADHRTKPNLASSCLSSGPGPPPSHLGPEPTSSSGKLPVCGQPEQTGSAGAAQPICPLQPDRTRSPSPRLAPVQPQLRSESEPQNPAAMEASGPVRTVPVQIVHSEGGVHRRGQLLQSTESGSPSSPPAEPASPFSTCNRQEPEPEPNRAQTMEEDAKRDELARDIMGRDKSLVDILDQSGRRTTMDLMEELFAPDPVLKAVQLRRRPSAGSRPPSTSRRQEEDVPVSASLVPSSSYYNTSAPKAELLIKMKDMQEQLDEQDSEDELDVDLASKKQELMSSLARKLAVLREARQSLTEDVEDNETLGRQVDATVRRLCRPNHIDRFRMFVGDLDKVVSLLLSLSGRLARVENALNSLEDGAPAEEKQTLTEKRKLLMRQHDDAKELKENLDRRERLVLAIMEAHLDAQNLDDYRHFVKMKSALIIEQRKLNDKIKLGEEQLKCLTESLAPEDRPPLTL